MKKIEIILEDTLDVEYSGFFPNDDPRSLTPPEWVDAVDIMLSDLRDTIEFLGKHVDNLEEARMKQLQRIQDGK